MLLAAISLYGCNTIDEITNAINKSECGLHKERFSEYVIEHPNENKDVVDAIREARILIGMTKDQAEASWGSRDTVTLDTGGTHWLWKYTEPHGHHITFKDGYHVSSVSTMQNPFTKKAWGICKKSNK